MFFGKAIPANSAQLAPISHEPACITVDKLCAIKIVITSA
jgi:hypothetical protein